MKIIESPLINMKYKRRWKTQWLLRPAQNPDIMYLHEAMRVPDQDQFLKAMDKELDDHISHEHWVMIPKEEVPTVTKLLDMVWAMHWK